ncbi:MAG: hypothetical protein PUC63_07310 [Clostridiales bacterium]|nr:hypothetical protein [Clostridiales bacterium]
MAEQIEKKHISDTIDFDRDIAPYSFSWTKDKDSHSSANRCGC